MKKGLKPHEEAIIILLCSVVVFIAALWFIQIAVILALITLISLAINKLRQK
jgi:hypothetical protein